MQWSKNFLSFVFCRKHVSIKVNFHRHHDFRVKKFGRQCRNIWTSQENSYPYYANKLTDCKKTQLHTYDKYVCIMHHLSTSDIGLISRQQAKVAKNIFVRRKKQFITRFHSIE